MRTIAVLADIHGNLPALEAVLADVVAMHADAIILDGDLADGPFPAETLDRLMALPPGTVMLRGNGDRWLRDAFDGRPRPAEAADAALIGWAARRITPRHRDLLAGLPLAHGFSHPVLGRVGVCHATARGDNEMLLVDAPAAQAMAAFAPLAADTVLVGHSHMPFDRLFDRTRVINVGSVGMAYGHGGASWAIVDAYGVTLRRTPYDTAAAARRIAASGMPDAADFAHHYVLTTYGDVEAMAAFRPVMDRQQASGLFD